MSSPLTIFSKFFATTRGKLVVAGCCVVLAGVVLLAQSIGGGGPAPLPTEYFYDVNTGELFAAPFGSASPTDAPSGAMQDGTPAGMVAYVFGCGSCASRHRQVAYITRMTPTYREARIRFADDDTAFTNAVERLLQVRPHEGEYVSLPESPFTWHRIDTEEARAIMERPVEICGGGDRVVRCWP